MHRRQACLHLFAATWLGTACKLSPRQAATPVKFFLPVPTLGTVWQTALQPEPGHAPVVIALHGNGGTPGAMLKVAANLGLASYIAIAPQGTHGASSGFSWFVASNEAQIVAASDAMALAQLQAVFDDVVARYQPPKIFILGHSQGGALAYLCAAHERQRLAGLIIFGADDPRSIVPATRIESFRELPVFLAHGQRDPIFAFTRAQGTRQALTSWGARVHFEPFAGGHEIDTGVLGRAGEWLRAL